jgi:hypothetical protein
LILEEESSSLAYESEADALRQLLLLHKHGGHITSTAEKIIALPDGYYYFVEVTSKEATKYVIEAYGEEAVELEREALRRKLEGELLITAK